MTRYWTAVSALACLLPLLGCGTGRSTNSPYECVEHSQEVAAGALSVLRTRHEVAAHNLANAQTTAFKASRVTLEELAPSERTPVPEERAESAKFVGGGVRVAGVRHDMSQGTAVATGRNLDLMIDGQGFFIVRLETQTHGGLAYTRAGNLAISADGALTNASGLRLEPTIMVPCDSDALRVSPAGVVSVTVSGRAERIDIGQVQIASFASPELLKNLGAGLYAETSASGPARTGDPGTSARGMILQGMLEGSNVDPVIERLELVRTASLSRAWLSASR